MNNFGSIFRKDKVSDALYELSIQRSWLFEPSQANSLILQIVNCLLQNNDDVGHTCEFCLNSFGILSKKHWNLPGLTVECWHEEAAQTEETKL